MRMDTSTSRYIRLIIVLVLILAIASAVSGCAKGEAHMTVHANGTGDLDLSIELDNTVLKAIGNDGIWDKLGARLAENGFQVDPLQEADGRKIFHASKSIDLKNKTMPPIPGISISREQTGGGWFATTEQMSVEADISKLLPEQAASLLNSKLAGLAPIVRKLALRQLQLDFKLTMPIKAEDHNADDVQDGGRTLVWHLSPIESNNIELAVNVPNLRNIAIAAGLGIGLPVLGIMLYVRARKRRKQAG